MTSILNRIVRTISQNSIFEDIKDLLVTSISFSQGDLIVFDTTGVRKVAAGETGANFLGIARNTVVSGVLAQPYTTDTSANVAGGSVLGPVYGVEAKLVGHTGDNFTAGCKVYIDGTAGTHHVTTTAITSAVAIGVYVGPTIASNSTGAEIVVRLGANYPVSTI